ncbi:MAG: D-alanine-D-alanine ligase [Parcubacteria group bacterium GW2011_GWF2_38_76]|nr:MAG: D-alanine-D-alanine ligase [Parcubacteria group bacterium GW2011_GWF2_38_76]
MKRKIAIICGGPSSEHEVSLQTGKMIANNLSQEKGLWQFGSDSFPLVEALRELKARKFNLVFIALHGAFGEDGHLQAMLDSIDLPYTGSNMLASAMAMDKNISNILFEQAGLAVPKYQIISKINDSIDISLPFVIKPLDGGSSIGVTIVKKESEIKEMAQRYINGREFTCAILDNIEGDPIALSPIEIIPRVSSFFDYEAKYEDSGSEEIINPEIGAGKLKELQELALKAHNVLGCSGMSRTDFMEEDGKFYVIETNTIPGMTKNSLLPKSAKGNNIEFEEVLNLIINSALKNNGTKGN